MQRNISSFFGANGSPVSNKRKQPDSEQQGTPTPKKKYQGKYEKQRVVQSDWFKVFPWLIHDQNDSVFRCELCVKTNKKNVFVSGKDDSRPKKDDFLKHEKCADHKMASLAAERQSDMRKATANASSHAKETVIALMRTVLAMAQEDIPNNKMACFIGVQVANNAPALTCLRKEDGSLSYTHHEIVEEIQQCLYKVVERDLLSAIHEAGLYAIEIDEATDSANKSILVVFVRFVGREGKPETHFLGVEELQSTTADSVTMCLTNLLKRKGLDVKNMVGLASDGAAVMRGSKNGVTTQFKKLNRYMIANHCLAHKLQLAAEKAANFVPAIVKYISTLNVFARCLKNSPKLTRCLENSKEVHNEKACKIKQAFFTRWLSLSDSTQALSGCLPSVISAVYEAASERTIQGQALLNGVVKDMATYKFLHLTHFLADAVGLLGILSKSLQVENPNHQVAKDQVDACITALESLRHMKGPHQKKVKGFPAEPPASGITEWSTHDMKDNTKQRTAYQGAVDTFLDEITTRLSCMMPDQDVMSGFDLFSAGLSADLKDKCLDKLVDFYGEPRGDQPAIINEDETRVEWALLQNMPDHGFNFLQTSREVYPNMFLLAKIGQTIPVTSVNCERGISRYNAIKTDKRSTMSVSAVNRIMLLSLEADEYRVFEYDSAFEDWAKMKSRRLLKF